MRVLFAVALLSPNVINGAEVTQKICVGLPSLALLHAFFVAQEKGEADWVRAFYSR